VVRQLQGMADFLKDRRLESISDISAIWTDAWPLLSRVAGPRNAPSTSPCGICWPGKGNHRAGLAFGTAPGPVTSCCTIGISTAEELPGKVEELRHQPVIRSRRPARRPRTVALHPVADLREADVDANCARGAVDVKALTTALRDLGVVLIEQPLRG